MEMAFVSANRLQIELDRKQGKLSGRIISFFTGREDKFITTLLIGNNIGLVVFGIFFSSHAEPYIIEYITSTKILILLIQTLLSTLIIVITAEFIPKSIFSIDPNAILRVTAIPLMIFYALLWIPTLFTTFISRIVLRIFMRKNTVDEKQNFNRVDLDDYVKQATEIAAPDQKIDHEVHLFKNALAFSKVLARDCMVPRTEIIAIEIHEPIEALKKKFIDTKLSKILVYLETIDDIIGYVHSYEIYKHPKNIKSVLRPISFVPESMPAQITMQEFIRQHRSIAVVVDEFGGTAGILTIEDLLEEIIGEIEDEHDTEDLIEEKINDKEFIFSGRLEVDYLNNKFFLNLPVSEAYETLAGYVLKLHQNIPEKGTIINSDNFTFVILEAIDNKIIKIKLILNY